MKKQVILFDQQAAHCALFPLTLACSTAQLRVGIFTIYQKWALRSTKEVQVLTLPYLQDLYPYRPDAKAEYLYVNAQALVDDQMVETCDQLAHNQGLLSKGNVIAFASSQLLSSIGQIQAHAQAITDWTSVESVCIMRPWDIFLNNRKAIEADFSLATRVFKQGQITDKHTIVYGKENIFVSENAHIRAAVLNAEDGPIFIGPQTHIQEGALIRGSLALCTGSQVMMGAKLKGDNSIGDFCKVGGEVSNSVLMAYSNKGHDGFLGNSVIGRWCNLGADTNSSNLKNNYGAVRVWSALEQQSVDTGLTFCGLMMGDHAKCGINTMFNTGTAVGFGANVFGAGFPDKKISNFAWGGFGKSERFGLQKFIQTAQAMMQRRQLSLSASELQVITYLHTEENIF